MVGDGNGEMNLDSGLTRAQLATVLECEPRGFTAERMNHWLNICTAKMITTGSAKPEEVAALRRLQGIVVG